MYKTSSGKQINNLIGFAKEIAAGGEGKILESPFNKNTVIKIYHQPRPAAFAKHLQLLSTLPASFVKPGEIYFDMKGKVAGFEMPYVNFNSYWLFNNLFNKGFCNTNSIDKAFKIKVLKKLRTCIEEIHAKNIIVGDLNQYNLFVSKTADVLFVDTDSYASDCNTHSGVLLDDIRDWTNLNINKQTDAWAYDILSFWATTFCHPFKWVVPGNTETLEQRVKTNKSFLSKIPGVKIPVLYEPLTGDVVRQFADIFAGRRYMVSFDTAFVQAPTIIKQPVQSASLIIRELFSNVVDVIAAPGQIAIKKGTKWILVETKTNQVTRQIKEVDCDILFPSNDTYAYSIKNILYDSKEVQRAFVLPEYYFVDGYLSVTDYATDGQYNFNINNQLAGIDSTFIPVFAKSITIRDCVIQNFGGKKYLNVPFKNKYTLIEVPFGTKNAWYTSGFAAIEYKEKSLVKFCILETSSKKQIDLDFLPYFAVKDKLIFVPEDGHIDVYRDFSLITTLDANICTRDSKLFSTDAGIILFDNKTVYLLNTKK